MMCYVQVTSMANWFAGLSEYKPKESRSFGEINSLNSVLHGRYGNILGQLIKL